MAKQTTRKTRTGRPTGAVTQQRPLMEEEINIECCKHCGETAKPVNRRNKRERLGDGTFGGRAYSGVTFWTANCGACGGAISVIQRHYTE